MPPECCVFFSASGLGVVLERVSFVATDCKACQIILDASLESISYSTNAATLAEIYTHQSDKMRNRRKPWGLAATGERRAGKMTDEMNERPVRCGVSVCVVLSCTCHKRRCWVLTWAWKPPPHRGWKSLRAHFCFPGRNADRLSWKGLNL